MSEYAGGIDHGQNSTAVAVGILRRQGLVLLCQRAEGARYGLMWEFPGGKVEGGETPTRALERELREELSVDVRTVTPFHRQTSYYQDGGNFEVHYFFVDAWDGVIVNNVFQDIRWVRPGQLPDYDILKGNTDVCRMLAGMPGTH